jgi:hypothetical protein
MSHGLTVLTLVSGLLLAGCPVIQPSAVTTPNVVGMTQAAAENAITLAGLTVGDITQVVSSTAPSGQVISQDPAAGETVFSGATVDIVIAQTAYDAGFADGFAQDDEYWQGYDDGYDTLDAGPIYYTGNEIPQVLSPEYDAGYWDGVWYAYNDGYFVDYDYAFTIGFSEGYDTGYSPLGHAFLLTDQHVEYLDGGWSDGYNDGFSEGRVFGVYDYEHLIAYDWLGALDDYRAGTDVTAAGVSTGDSGPVTIYEYGVDPHTLVKSAPTRIIPGRPIPAIRPGPAKTDAPAISYRALPSKEQDELKVTPTTSLRSTHPLTLTTSWLDRVNAYRATLQ